MQPIPANGSYPDMTPNVVSFNFGLKARHFAMLFAALVAAGGSLGTAGWLAMPAKQTDVVQLQGYHTDTTANISRIETNLTRVEAKLDALTNVVLDSVRRQPVPAPRRKPLSATAK